MPPMWIVLALLPILGGAERFNCKGRILGAYYADAKSGCKAFHVCVRVAGGGIRDFRFFCPPGTLFHQEAQTCTDWGDDDPLACPAEIYDGFDTKKLSAGENRDEEAEFGLQRAETGDRRLSQGPTNLASSGASDLRTAHSSDFFSGQRERGRDDSFPTRSPVPSSHTRQSFRRTTTHRPYSQPTTQIATSLPSSSLPSSPAQYDVTKRKLIRKRPIHTSTPIPQTTATQNTQSTQTFSQQSQQPYQQYHRQPQQQQYQRQPQQVQNQQTQQQTNQEQSQQEYFQQKSQQQNQQQPEQHQLRQSFSVAKPQETNQQHNSQQQIQQRTQQNNQQQSQQLQYFLQKPQQRDQGESQQQPQQQTQQQQLFQQKPLKESQDKYQQQKSLQSDHQSQQQQTDIQLQSQQRHNNIQNFNRRTVPQNPQTTLTSTTPTLPPQFKEYKDEYVEVSRVSPKQSKHFASNSPPAPYSQTTPVHFNKKYGLVELYNYNAQSTPGLNGLNKNRQPIKVETSVSVTDAPYELKDFLKARNVNSNNDNIRGTTKIATTSYNTAATSTPPFKNYNSVTYNAEKSNFAPFSKQNNFNSPSTTPTTTIYTTTRANPPPNLNTIAYNTNLGFNAHNYDHAEEDDGQYRPPQGEDDGQYKPEIYDRELLSGAHSLNIAASGNRLPEDQKSRGKSQTFKASSQTVAPRPFRPAPTPPSLSTQTTYVPESTYTTTIRTQTRNFDFHQTYTTTSRPSDPSAFVPQNVAAINNAATRTTIPNNRPEPRPPSPPTLPPAHVSRPATSTVPPYFANPANKKEDTSYDYAYYDSDPGFVEYDHIEEFGRTKTKA
ncbi:ataxin-2 homolog isoform X2 [Achroia grisella]|uniref:ataxin-2 homolog isoform X2 n=1 Tax=Achroia grisella TaxID=688607 RepID=UPI0027D216CF|nr:ataxin-2 homolog isoform X2 [Achroia grisella]